MLTKTQERMVNRLREHGYQCNVSFEGVIIYSQIKRLDDSIAIIDHLHQGEHLSRMLEGMLSGISHSDLRDANTDARNALIHIEDFVKDHAQYEENTDLRYALNCLASVLAKTESNLRNKEATTFIKEKEKNDD